MELPVGALLPQLLRSLDTCPRAVLAAPPGAGKTSLVPPALLTADWCRMGKILLLEPRRLAARAAAARMAALRGEPLGQSIGLQTRIERVVSPATRIEVITEGLLIRRLLADPGLEDVAAVIFDEVHERGLDADLALALCLDLQCTLRPELRLLAMSATADTARLAQLLAAPVIESAGRAYPVDIRHAARDLAGAREVGEAVARAVRAALAAHAGDILAFLPGMADIRRAEAALAGCGATVLALHGDLAPEAQALALQPAADGSRRVVLASAIAETSLTVPGVRVVVDGGWRRAPRHDPASGLSRLTTLRISRAAAAQRAGRAGREAPGVAIRLWSEALHRGLSAFDTPEILDAELSALCLDCAAWGTAPEMLAFADPPPAAALASARALLRALGAFDAGGAITDRGRAMARLGAHPRLAAIMLAAGNPTEAALAADLAALLEERDPLRRSQRADPPADIAPRLAALRGAAAGDLDHAALAAIRRGAASYRRRLRLPADTRPGGDPAPLLAHGFPDRIAQRRSEPGSFRLSGGGGARLADTDALARAPLLVVPTLALQAAPRIRLAAALDPAALTTILAGQIQESQESGIDPASGAVLLRRRRRLGVLVLEDRTERAPPAFAAACLAEAADLASLPWSTPARQLQARVGLLHALEPTDWPDLSDAALAADKPGWLEPALLGCARLADLATLDMAAILAARLDFAQRRRLNRLLPEALDLPGGRAAIDYLQPVPQAAARAQAFYGLAETPRLAEGRIPLRLALLSPAGRPMAITADLAGFWRGAWGEIRREMRGRYPKHAWPEDPMRLG